LIDFLPAPPPDVEAFFVGLACGGGDVVAVVVVVVVTTILAEAEKCRHQQREQPKLQRLKK
jgi:hypothetical protein